MGHPSVFPTGTTNFDPDRCWGGYTVFPSQSDGAVLVDMNGNVVRNYPDLLGFPVKVLPGGFFMGSTERRDPKYGFQDSNDLVQIDFEGRVVWRFSRYELVRDGGDKRRWIARQHHDYQREGNPVGYYAPRQPARVDGGSTLVLCHRNVSNPRISDTTLLDDTFVEVDWSGKVQWEWRCSDHVDELGFEEAARTTMYRYPNRVPAAGGFGDWLHVNALSRLGPNRHFDAGDERFHPDNLIWDARQANIIAITSRATGEVVWRLGPDFTATKALRRIRQIIGQHHAHLIPQGLPGAGNLLVYDNGGWAGYGSPNPGSYRGVSNALRDYSRVLEIDPVTLEVVWQYTPVEAGFRMPVEAFKFYSGFISSAQRLPNGNTLITEGADGRLLEVTAEHEIVWEYVSPFFGRGDLFRQNTVYRAYRVPYAWIPQLDVPTERAVEPPKPSAFHVGDAPGSAVPTRIRRSRGKVQVVAEACVLPEELDDD